MLEPICENIIPTEDDDKKKKVITFYKLSFVIR